MNANLCVHWVELLNKFCFKQLFNIFITVMVHFMTESYIHPLQRVIGLIFNFIYMYMHIPLPCVFCRELMSVETAPMLPMPIMLPILSPISDVES